MKGENRMKEKLAVLCSILMVILILGGCTDEKMTADTGLAADRENYPTLQPVGQLPDEFEKVVENNEFKNIVAFDGRLLKTELSDVNEKDRTATQNVIMMDVYGNMLSSYSISSDDAYSVRTLIATEDGGFLFVLGFEDYAYGQSTWASDNGFASRIIKCDKRGKLQFDTALDGVEGDALRVCLEKDENYYFFGTMQTPETKTRGVYSCTDVYMSVLDKNGNFLKSQCIAGSDFDSLEEAEIGDNGFILSISSQSDDGDFSGSDSDGYPTDWIFYVNNDLEITKKQRQSGRDFFDIRIGEKEGSPVYMSDDLFKDFDAGMVTAFIDYGSFYMIVSERNTGEYENTPPMINSIWYYTETVYSGYDENANLIFRTMVDSSPDYDAMAKKY